ncbi:RNA polymerase sigma factor SigJ [Nonomuraea sp. NPDC048826]|uniref:RNA polymerase sigma factor SigJ n=1 Tax=Nonomuraea sp. NPDC048826 TaxID=3364347 RepID=UPI00372401D5
MSVTGTGRDPAVAWRRFEEHRAHLMGVAYHLLGSVGEAEDAVQETYLRLARTDLAAIGDLRSWLTTVVTRICLDQLTSARARRERYAGPWLPEPVVEPVAALGPEERIALVDSVGYAMLVVLESLSPAERIVFVLHEAFGFTHAEIARITGRHETACRQLLARARRHVTERAPRFTPDREEHRTAVTAFLRAAAHGDLDELAGVLDPRVVLRSDGGGHAPAARRPVTGAHNVARLLLGAAARDRTVWCLTAVNGSTGAIFTHDGRVVGVMAFTVLDGRVSAIDFVINPEKLRHLGRDRRPRISPLRNGVIDHD